MFIARLKNSNDLKNLFDAVNSVLTEVNILIDSDGIRIDALGSMRVAMISLQIKREDFEIFELPEEDASYTIGINTTDLLKILKRGSASDHIMLEYTDEKSYLYVVIESADQQKNKRFSLSTISLDDEAPPIDQLNQIEFSNIIRLNCDEIEEALNDALIYTDAINVQIDSQEKEIHFSTEGSIGDLKSVLKEEEFEIIEMNTDCRVVFTIAKFKNIMKISTLSDSFEFSIENEKPAKLFFDLFSSSSATYFIAPRVESDTDEYS